MIFKVDKEDWCSAIFLTRTYVGLMPEYIKLTKQLLVMFFTFQVFNCFSLILKHQTVDCMKYHSNSDIKKVRLIVDFTS